MANVVFSGVRAKWLPLYEQLRGMAMDKLGVFDEHETSNAVLWRYHSAFAEVSANKACMVVAFASDVLHDEWESSKVLQTSKSRVVHYFEVTDNALFPELIERITQAYILTQSNRVRKEPAKNWNIPPLTNTSRCVRIMCGTYSSKSGKQSVKPPRTQKKR